MPKPLILIIDDEVMVASSIKQQLLPSYDSEFDIETASSSEEAMELIEEWNQNGIEIPVVICDQNLPGVMGDDFLIRLHAKNPRTKKILLTGHIHPDTIRKLENRADLYRFMPKPWDSRDLLITIREAIKSFYTKHHLSTAYRDLERSYLFSSDTGFPNRHSLKRRISQLSTNPYSLGLIRVDSYQVMVNVFGLEHYYGLMKTFLDLLKIHFENVDPKAEIYHIYPDEIAIISFSDQKVFHNALSSFKLQIASDYMTHNDVPCKIKISISLIENSDNMYQKASLAFFKMKQDTDSLIVEYVPEENRDLYANNKHTAQIICRALNEKTVIPYFQAIYDNKQKRIEKYECLARLVHDGKILTPDKFINISKDTGQIKHISMIVIEKAISKITGTDIQVSVNISESELDNRGFVKWMDVLLKFYKISPERLTVEVLESVDLGNNNFRKNILFELRELGCKIAIDDFGSELSNLSRIVELNPDYIKIDGKLITDIHLNPTAEKVVAGIHSISQSLGSKVVAEFVSSKEIYDVIDRIGIEYSQGYYISMPEEDFLKST